MRCASCDRALTDYESTMKDAITGEYLDLCVYCLDKSGIPEENILDRPDLIGKDTQYE